jgi:hypothetical protein
LTVIRPPVVGVRLGTGEGQPADVELRS